MSWGFIFFLPKKNTAVVVVLRIYSHNQVRGNRTQASVTLELRNIRVQETREREIAKIGDDSRREEKAEKWKSSTLPTRDKNKGTCRQGGGGGISVTTSYPEDR